MAEADTTQTVVEKTDEPAAPASEGTDARTDQEPDLESLLSQYDGQDDDKGSGSSTPEAKPDAAGETVEQRVERLERERAEERQQFMRQQFQTEMKSVVQDIRGDIPEGIYDDDDITDWIDRQATADRRIAKAWQNRHNDPKGFEGVKKALGKKLAAKFSNLPDAGATEDRDAVTAAVRGASTKAPEGQAPDYGQVNSNQEFADMVEKETGVRPPL